MSRHHPFDTSNADQKSEYAQLIVAEPVSFEEVIADLGGGELKGRLERRQGQSFPRFLMVATLLVFGLLAARLYHLTVNRHGELRAVAEGNRLRVEYLSAPRGTIYDSRGLVLAASRPNAELTAFPLDLPAEKQVRDRIIEQISAIVGSPIEQIEQALTSTGLPAYESVLIKQNLSRDESLIIEERALELPGFRVITAPIRDYQRTPDAYVHLLGYVGKLTRQEYDENAPNGYLYNDSVGKIGLEWSYETDLRGEFGQRQVEVDARGQVKRIFGATEPVPGANLVLNIDSELQEELYANLIARLATLGRRRAAALAMDPRSGRVLAFMSLPGFDNNLFAAGIGTEEYGKLTSDPDEPLLNRAIRGIYPPGSTVKPMVSIAALEEGVITPSTVIKDDGTIVIKNIYGGADSVFIGYGRKALGLLTVSRAIALSSDIFFYIVGGGFGPASIEGLGIERIAEYYRMFRIHEKLGIDLPGEQAGLVPDPEWKKKYFAGDSFSEKWYLGDTYHVSIGQGDLLVTPISVLSWTATIANGGKIFRPFIVDRVEDQGQVVKKFEPEVIGEIGAATGNIRVVQEGMREAVLYGTASSLQRLPVSSAAKTGTAQFDAKNRNRSHAWFTAYAPFENPEIAIMVLIEDGGEGGVASMPVVRDTLDWWAKNRYQP